MGQTMWLKGEENLSGKEVTLFRGMGAVLSRQTNDIYTMLTGFFDAEAAWDDKFLRYQTGSDICYFFVCLIPILLFHNNYINFLLGITLLFSAHLLGWDPIPARSETHGPAGQLTQSIPCAPPHSSCECLEVRDYGSLPSGPSPYPLPPQQ